MKPSTLLLPTGYLVLQRARRTAEDGDMTARLSIGMAKFHYAIGILLLVTAGIHLWLALTREPAPGELTS